MPFPQLVRLYAHRQIQSNYEVADQIGLVPQAAEVFKFAGTEVELLFEVQSTGEAKLVGADGRYLCEKRYEDDGKKQ